MKCYDFELNISAYIEGHLQQVVRKEFNKHKETCNHCSEKLKDVSQLMNEMPKMASLTTSHEFIHNLNIKIQEIDNQKPSFWETITTYPRMVPPPPDSRKRQTAKTAADFIMKSLDKGKIVIRQFNLLKLFLLFDAIFPIIGDKIIYKGAKIEESNL